MIKSTKHLIKGAYGGISREVWLLSLTQFINRSGTMVIFFLAVYLKDILQYNLDQVGIVMAMFGAGSLLGVFLGGKLVDKLGYYPIMLTSLLAGGVMFFVVSMIDHFLVLSIGMFFLSAMSEAFRPANMVAISHFSTSANYTRSISLYRLAMNLGFSIGPAIGGIVATYSYKWIFWMDGGTCIFAAVLLVLFIGNKKEAEVEKAAEQEEKVETTPTRSAYRDRAFLFFLPLTTLYAMSFFQFFSTMSIYYKNEAMLSEGQIGILLALNGLIVASVEMLMIYKIEKKGSVFNWIMLGAFLVLVSYVMLLFVTGMFWLIIITIIISFSEMFAMPFMNTFMNQRSVKSNKGQYASLYVMAWSVAQILIPIVSTQVIDHLNYAALWIIMGSISLVVMVGTKILKDIVARE
jgi:predicted MFS family arabinose efflux permease